MCNDLYTRTGVETDTLNLEDVYDNIKHTDLLSPLIFDQS